MFAVKDVARAVEFGVQAANYASFTLNVKSYDTALKAYALDAADRKAATLTDQAVLQLQEDPNTLLLLWSVTDVARAKAFFSSAKLAEHMATQAGVIGTPEGHFWKS